MLFSSSATNLQPRATTVTQIYRKDRVTSVTTLVSSTPDGTPADLDVPAISAVMRDDGRIVALGGGFQALWPLTAGVVTYPWVMRDLEANTFTPVPAPPRRREGLPSFHPSAEVAGLLARRAARLSRQRDPRGPGLLGASRSGTTIEYNIAGSPHPAALPGFSQPSASAFVDGRDVALVTGRCFSQPFLLANFSRYDASPAE